MTPRTRELIVATRNPGKAGELRALLAPLGRPLLDLGAPRVAPAAPEGAVECAAPVEGDALAKAPDFSPLGDGRAVIADDSGLCVAALGGAPGVHSRRYAGAVGSGAAVDRANCAKLLAALADASERRAEFVCAVAYVGEGRELVALGRTSGRILGAPRGAGGFGYDPLFLSDDLGHTFAEASEAEKGRVSHRARAVARMVQTLTAGGPGGAGG